MIHRVRVGPPIPVLALAASLVLSSSCGPAGDRPAKVAENRDWSLLLLELDEGVRYVRNRVPKEWLEVDRANRPPRGAHLVFWDYQPATRDEAGRTFVADLETSRLLVLDERLRPIAWRRPTGQRGERLTRPTLVSAWRNDTLAAFERSGDIVILDLWGRTFERQSGPFAVHVGAWMPDRRLLVARSPVVFPFNLVESGEPLVALLSPAPDSPPTPIDTVDLPPPEYWYSGIALNTGMVAVDSTGAFYFAWLTKPEIRKYDPAGKLVWVSQRRVPFAVEVPRLVPMGGGERPRLRLHTVHKGIAIGPDGLLYARAAADTTGARDRLEAIEPATGIWLRSAPLDTGTLVLVGPRGRAWEMAPERLGIGAEPERQPFTAYALETTGGDTVRQEDARGRTLVVAFWASWCTPCREELPLLDTLYRNTPRDQLEVHAISDDVPQDDARRFAESLDLSFPILLGRGKMRDRYHYHGLPYTVLVDRRGRVVREFYGFGGRDDYVNKVVPLIRQEIEAEP